MDILALLVPVLLAVIGYAVWRHFALRRNRAVAGLLDRADALEAILLRTRSRMKAMQQVVERVPSDVGARAQASLDTERQVQSALRDVLEHRLWIARHAETAPYAELVSARKALDRAVESLGSQLDRLESAGADLEDATAGAIEAAAREPASLTRRDTDAP